MRLGEAPLQRPPGGVADRGGVGQDRLHPLVRRERLAVHDADRRELAGELDVVAGRRLGLDVGVDHLEEAGVARRDGVEGEAGALDELRLRDLRLARQPHRAGQRLGDAGAVAARHVGVDLQVRLHVLDRRLRVVVDQVGARGIEDVVGLRMRDEVAALGQRPVIAGRHDQVLAAEAAVGTGAADVDDPGEPHVVDRADRVGGLLDHHRAVAEVDRREVVDRVGVGGEEQRARVHQLGEDDDAVRAGDLLEALAQRIGRGAAEAVVVDRERVGEVHRVVDLARRCPHPARRP